MSNGFICNDSSSESEGEYIEEPYVDTSMEGLCLFCSQTEIDCDRLVAHLQNVHSVNLKQLCSSYHLDTILYIKLINFIRSQAIQPNQMEDILSKNEDWKTDDFMKPVKENDLLLTLDVGNDWEEEEGDYNGALQKSSTQQPSETLLQKELDKVRSLINDLNEMEEPRPSHQVFDSDSYFSSYSHYSIHWEMLSDRPRTESYRQAILSNGDKFTGSSCLDIGCGTGILSLFAVKAGASKIVAVDQSDIIYSAMDIAQENGVSESITFKKGKLEDLELNEKFDIIVSEWMGYFLLFEGMLDTVIYARDKYLKPGGLMLPRSCSIFMAALSDDQLYTDRIAFWNDVYGFKMTSMRKDVLNEVLIKEINSQSIISDKVEIKAFNLMTCTIKEAQQVESAFNLNMKLDGTVHGLVFWFDCYFDGPTDSTNITLTTSPHSPVTHWKQSVLFLKEPIQVSMGDCLTGQLELSRCDDNFRSLKMQLTIDGKGVQRFIMN